MKEPPKLNLFDDDKEKKLAEHNQKSINVEQLLQAIAEDEKIQIGVGQDEIRYIAKSLKEHKNYKEDFERVQLRPTKDKANNMRLIKRLQKRLKGIWTKVYHDGYDNEIKKSEHYHLHESGAVFGLKYKLGWSNTEE